MAGSTLCCVCGNSGANFNYNAMVCGPCRVFFYRCVKYESPKSCLYKGNCVIKNVKRGNCSYCRYQKCLSMNMDESQVCRRNKIKVVQIPPSYINEFMRFYHPQMLFRYPIICNVSLELIELLQRKSLNFNGSCTRFTEHSNLCVGLQDIIKEPGICSSKETSCIPTITPDYQACIDYSIFSNDICIGKYYFMRSYARWISSFADLLNSTFYFAQISFTDQLKLIQHNACDYEILTAIQYKILEHDGARIKKMEEDDEKYWKTEGYFNAEKMTELLRLRTSSFNYLLSLIGPICKKHGFDELEFTAMKVISLFRAPCELSFQAQKVVNIARELFTLKLAEYISSTQSNLNKVQQLQRVAAILEIGGIVKREGVIISQLYVQMITTDFDGMGMQLPYEVHIQKIL